MILYHGTNKDFDSIDLNLSNPYKDFGRGFYLTEIRKQAEKMAQKKSKIYGGFPIVQEYEFDLSDERIVDLKVMKFLTPNKEWANFIYKNRNRNSAYTHEYDIVIGPIADDGVAYLLGRYEEGTLNIDELARELEYKKLNNQYFFGTKKSLELLKRK